MFKVTQEHLEELQKGNVPEGINQRLRDDIEFMLKKSGEALIAFHPTSICTFAAIVETELFLPEEMEEIKSEPHAVIKQQS